MVEIKPYRGVLYNKEKIKDFDSVITPPYDVIDQKEKEGFYILSSYNMVRLLFGEDKEGNGIDIYAKAAKDFKEWQDKNILIRDDKESIYIYSQGFSYKEKSFVRIGFISLVKLEELGKVILPHEKTLDKPFRDRLALLNAIKANVGCVFMLYDDRQKIIDSIIQEKIHNNNPYMEFKDKYGIMHKLWKVADKGFADKIKKEMSRYQCIIADGHHRYRSVLKFREEHPELKDAQYTVCCFINSFNEGLFVLPIDRFVFNLAIEVDKILIRLVNYFEIEELKTAEELIQKMDNTQIMVDKTINLKNHVFGMYCFSNKRSYLLRLKDNNLLDEYYEEKTDVYKKLDVNILHKVVFNDILGITEEDQLKGTHIEYTKGSKRALDKLNEEKYQFAFFLNPPLMREIFLTARAGETMPQKSTYFYPKVYSGLAINKIEK